MRNISALSASTTTTPSIPVRPTARVQQTTARRTPAQDDLIGLASADVCTPVRTQHRRPRTSPSAGTPVCAAVDVRDDGGLLFGRQLAEALPAPPTPTTRQYEGDHSTLTNAEFMEMLAGQRPAEEACAEGDPDVDITGTGNVTATGQASAAVVSAPDYRAGTYLDLTPDRDLVVPFPPLDRFFSFRSTDRQTNPECLDRRC